MIKLIKSTKQKLLQYQLPIVSGLVIGTSYIPFPPWGIFFCFTFLWAFAVRNTDLKTLFIGGWITQFVFNLIGFNWISHTATVFGNFPVWAGWLVLLLFCSTASLQVPISLVTWRWVLNKKGQKPAESFLSLMLLAALTSWIWHIMPMIFPWHLGYTWIGLNNSLILHKYKGFQVADIIGFEGLHTLTLLINVLVLMSAIKFIAWWKAKSTAAKNQDPAEWQAHRHGAALAFSILFGFIIPLLYLLHHLGEQKERLWQADEQSEHVHILAVQGNIGNFEKVEAEHGRGYEMQILNTYLNETEKGLAQTTKKPTLVVWPETAFPVHLDNIDEVSISDSSQFNITARSMRFLLSQKLYEFMSRHQEISLLTGAYSYERVVPSPSQNQKQEPRPSTYNVYNGMFWLKPLNETTSSPQHHLSLATPPYRKSILLAYGEYFPGADLFPMLMNLFPNQSAFARGPGPQVLDYSNLRLGPQICYEGLDTGFSRKLTEQHIDLFINITNDSWFGVSDEPYQHKWMTLARAIEFRKPMVRVTNTGFTAAILADGQEIEGHIPLHQAGSQWFDIPYRRHYPHFSMYTYLEPYWGSVLVAWNLLIIALVFWSSWQKKKLNPS